MYTLHKFQKLSYDTCFIISLASQPLSSYGQEEKKVGQLVMRQWNVVPSHVTSHQESCLPCSKSIIMESCVT